MMMMKKRCLHYPVACSVRFDSDAYYCERLARAMFLNLFMWNI